MRGWAVLMTGAMLAGCQAPSTNEQAAKTSAANGASPAQSGYIAKVLALPPRQLNGVLYRAIDDAGQKCQGIGEALRQADKAGKPMWAVRCIDGGAWLITIADDGNASVTGIPAKPGG